MPKEPKTREERLAAVAESILVDLEIATRWSRQALDREHQASAAEAIWHLAHAYEVVRKHAGDGVG